MINRLNQYTIGSESYHMMQDSANLKYFFHVLVSGMMKSVDLIIEGVRGWTAGALMFCYFFADRAIRYSLLAHYSDPNRFAQTAMQIQASNFEMVKRYCLLYCLCFLIYHIFHHRKPIINLVILFQYVFFLVAIYSVKRNYGIQWTDNVYRDYAIREIFLTAVFFLAIGSNLPSDIMKKIMRFCCWTYIIVLTYTNFISLRMSFDSDSTGLLDLFRNYGIRVILRLEPPSSTVIWPHRLKGFYGNATSLGIREVITILCAGWLLRDQKNRLNLQVGDLA